jgi:hypothetical protein
MKFRSVNQSKKDFEKKNKSLQIKKNNVPLTQNHTIDSNSVITSEKPPVPFQKRIKNSENKEKIKGITENKEIKANLRSDKILFIETKQKKENLQHIERLAKPKKVDISNDPKIEKKIPTNSRSTKPFSLRSSSDPPNRIKNEEPKVRLYKEAVIDIANNKKEKEQEEEITKEIEKYYSNNMKSYLPSFLTKDITSEKNQLFFPKTLPSCETVAQSIELKGANFASSFEKVSFEKGFIKNKYKDLLESLKC